MVWQCVVGTKIKHVYFDEGLMCEWKISHFYPRSLTSLYHATYLAKGFSSPKLYASKALPISLKDMVPS